jgi:enoyl-CoA hydratase/carnithine racemase
MNRPERLNALNSEMRTALAELWTEFRHDRDLQVAIFTGMGRGFCAGEDGERHTRRQATCHAGSLHGRHPGETSDPAVNGFASN